MFNFNNTHFNKAHFFSQSSLFILKLSNWFKAPYDCSLQRHNISRHILGKDDIFKDDLLKTIFLILVLRTKKGHISSHRELRGALRGVAVLSIKVGPEHSCRSIDFDRF